MFNLESVICGFMGVSGLCLDEVLVELCFGLQPFVHQLRVHLALVLEQPETEVELASGQLGLEGKALRFVGLLVPEDVHLQVLEVVFGLVMVKFFIEEIHGL